MLNEAHNIQISWIDDIGKKLRNVVRDLPTANLEKVLDDLKQFQNRTDNVGSLRRTFSSLNDAQLTAAVKSLISQNIPDVNQFVTEVISSKLVLNFQDFRNVFESILNSNPILEVKQKDIVRLFLGL